MIVRKCKEFQEHKTTTHRARVCRGAGVRLSINRSLSIYIYVYDIYECVQKRWIGRMAVAIVGLLHAYQRT